ncbi:MAG: M50 family metallopeptidase [Clostridia bacterium]|nr:M50 family metallopeptidase [Clostridia bacterium]
MIDFSIKGTRVRIHGSILVMMAVTSLVSGGVPVMAMMASVAFHEAGHALAAKLSGARISEIELMPFGAAARIDDMHNLKPGKAVAVALAGPVASALMCAAFYYGTTPLTRLFYRINLTIAAFNMLPALPLDGGRVMCRILGLKFGAKQATGIGVATGRAVAISMLLITAAGAAVTGRINLTYAMSAAYMLMSHKRERLAAGNGALLSLLDREAWLKKEGTMPVRWLAAREDTPLTALLPDLKPGCVHRVAVYDDDMKLSGIVEENMILKTALDDKPTCVGDMLAGYGARE